MSDQPRVAKVLIVLLVSMTVGAIVLMALGRHPPKAPAFALCTYYGLDPIEKVITSTAAQTPSRWNAVEIYYSATKAGNIEQLASLDGLAGPDEVNCHFCVCNGLGGGDGQIFGTQKWKRQWSCIPGRTWYGTAQTIRICIIADNAFRRVIASQKRRTNDLIEAIRRKFQIPDDAIFYPEDWR